MTDPLKKYTVAEACEYLSVGEHKLSPRTLDNWRSLGKGPKPTKIGRVVYYTQESLDSYIRKKTGFDTSDAA